MLCRSDQFMFDGHLCRLIDAEAVRRVSWLIRVEAPRAWPFPVETSKLPDRPLEPEESSSIQRDYPAKWHDRAKVAYERIKPLIEAGPKIYNASKRNALIEQRAREVRCSARTLHKDLRRWWQRGMSVSALLPSWKSARTATVCITGRRGRKAKKYVTYQVTTEDHARFEQVLDQHLTDARKPITRIYKLLIDAHYAYRDGNGKSYWKFLGERPSVRQFRRYYDTTHSYERKVRRRRGDKTFERDYRSKLGDVLKDNLGVGHRYETDAAWIQVHVVSSDNVVSLMGFPMLYLIVDQRSRLIVGFYLGIDNASWDIVREAFISIFEDKKKLCEYYGVEYDPEHWPAHGICPQFFLSDRGPEMFGTASDLIAEALHAAASNAPAMRADLKPFVECGFRLMGDTLSEGTPGLDPKRNRQQRRRTPHDKEASLTLRQLGKVILEAIIRYNKSAILDYPRTNEQRAAGLYPTPIDLWNDGIATRSGQLRRMSAQEVRAKLLPAGQASVTPEGILFKGCYYTSSDPRVQKMFVESRTGRKKLGVRYDRRLVDTIYLDLPDSRGELPIGRLSPRSERYGGLHFDEVAQLENLDEDDRAEWKQHNEQVGHEYRQAVEPVTQVARSNLAAAGRVSISARRAGVREDRKRERKIEHRERGGAEPAYLAQPALPATPNCSSNVLSLPVRAIPHQHATAREDGGESTMSPAERARLDMIDEESNR